MVTKPDFDTLTAKRPAGSSRNSYRPCASVNAVFDPISGLLMRTCARRTVRPVSAATTRPRTRPVPVLAGRPGGSIIGISPGLIGNCAAGAGAAVSRMRRRAQAVDWLRIAPLCARSQLQRPPLGISGPDVEHLDVIAEEADGAEDGRGEARGALAAQVIADVRLEPRIAGAAAAALVHE